MTSQGSSQHLVAVYSSDIPSVSCLLSVCLISSLFANLSVTVSLSFCIHSGFPPCIFLCHFLLQDISETIRTLLHAKKLVLTLPPDYGKRPMCPLIYFPRVPEVSSYHSLIPFLLLYFEHTCDFAHLTLSRFFLQVVHLPPCRRCSLPLQEGLQFTPKPPATLLSFPAQAFGLCQISCLYQSFPSAFMFSFRISTFYNWNGRISRAVLFCWNVLMVTTNCFFNLI